MKFSCNQNTLAKALNIVSKAVTSRTTIPILKGILLKVDANGVLSFSFDGGAFPTVSSGSTTHDVVTPN